MRQFPFGNGLHDLVPSSAMWLHLCNNFMCRSPMNSVNALEYSDAVKAVASPGRNSSGWIYLMRTLDCDIASHQLFGRVLMKRTIPLLLS